MTTLASRGVNHFGLEVPDLDEAVEFFTSALGFQLLYRVGPFDVTGVGKLTLAMTRHGEQQVELLEWDTPQPRPPAAGSHVALHVVDIDAAIARMRDVPGVEVLGEPATIEAGPTAGLRWVYFRAPWGLELELVTPR